MYSHKFYSVGITTSKKSRIQETLTLSRVRIITLFQKKKIFGSNLKHLTVFKAQLELNPEQPLVLKAQGGDNPRVENLPHMDNLQVQFETTPCF